MNRRCWDHAAEGQARPATSAVVLRTEPLERGGNHPQFLANGLSEVFQRIYPHSTLDQFVQFAESYVRLKVIIDRYIHDSLSAFYGSGQT